MIDTRILFLIRFWSLDNSSWKNILCRKKAKLVTFSFRNIIFWNCLISISVVPQSLLITYFLGFSWDSFLRSSWLKTSAAWISKNKTASLPTWFQTKKKIKNQYIRKVHLSPRKPVFRVVEKSRFFFCFKDTEIYVHSVSLHVVVSTLRKFFDEICLFLTAGTTSHFAHLFEKI